MNDPKADDDTENYLFGESIMDTQKPTPKRLKSATRYPKKKSAYVIAFALHDTYNDLATAQQMICNRKSSKDSDSFSSIGLDANTSNNKSNDFLNQEQNPDSITDINVPKVNDNVFVADIHLEIDKYQKGDVTGDTLDQPQVIYSAPFKRRKSKKQRNNPKLKKMSNNKGVLDIRNINFKGRCNKSIAAKKLRNFYSKARYNSTADNLKFCTNSTINVVSRSRILKKVLAKENLLDTDSLGDGTDFDQNDSIRSSVLTVREYNSGSQNSLVRNNSMNLSDDENNQEYKSDPIIIDSTITLSTDNSHVYATDVLNLSVSVSYNSSKNENVTNSISEERISCDQLTSTMPMKTEGQSSGTLISTVGSRMSNGENNDSYVTLIGSDHGRNQYPENDSDLYLCAESSSTGNTMFIPDLASQNTVEIINNPTFRVMPQEKTISQKQALLDSVINLGKYSDFAESNSAQNVNEINGDCNENNGINNNLNFKHTGDHECPSEKKSLTGIFSEPPLYTSENTVQIQRNINFPSEDLIKNILKDRESLRKKSRSDEISVHPRTISELWERIVVILDLTVKRLEDNLAEKIVTELMKTGPAVSKLARPIPDTQLVENNLSAKPVTLNNEEINLPTDESAQCDLVKNQMIDNILLKLSIQNTKRTFVPSTSKIPLKIKKPKVVNDFLEVLKPPTVDVDVEKGDTVTLSTEFAPVEETVENSRVERLVSLLNVPVAFVRENFVVIGSVTNFVVVMLCLYAIFLVIMKP